MMRKSSPTLSIAAMAVLAASAFAEPEAVSPNYGGAYAVAPAVGGVAA
jgi:hypothetical protein